MFEKASKVSKEPLKMTEDIQSVALPARVGPPEEHMKRLPTLTLPEDDDRTELTLCQKTVKAYTFVLSWVILVPGMVVTTACALVGVLGAIGLITVVAVTFMCLVAVKLLLSFCCLPCNPEFIERYNDYRKHRHNYILYK